MPQGTNLPYTEHKKLWLLTCSHDISSPLCQSSGLPRTEHKNLWSLTHSLDMHSPSLQPLTHSHDISRKLHTCYICWCCHRSLLFYDRHQLCHFVYFSYGCVELLTLATVYTGSIVDGSTVKLAPYPLSYSYLGFPAYCGH